MLYINGRKMMIAGGGGHSIKNDSGTALDQKDNLQFKGTYSINSGDNSIVNISRTMTSAQYALLSEDEKKGFIDVTDEAGDEITADDIAYDSNNSIKDAIDDNTNITGVARNNLFKTKNLGTINNLSDIEALISDHGISTGIFNGLELGNEITINDGTYNATWVIAGFDVYYNKGLSTTGTYTDAILSHHIGLIPKITLANARMTPTAATTGGYIASEMFLTTLPGLDTKLKTKLGSHLLQIPTVCSNAVTTGHSSESTWQNDHSACSITMTEIQVFGSCVYGNRCDIGEGNEKLPIFNFITPTYYNRTEHFWLRTISSDNTYVIAANNGDIYHFGSNNTTVGFRPLILIG